MIWSSNMVILRHKKYTSSKNKKNLKDSIDYIEQNFYNCIGVCDRSCYFYKKGRTCGISDDFLSKRKHIKNEKDEEVLYKLFINKFMTYDDYINFIKAYTNYLSNGIIKQNINAINKISL